MAKKSPSVTKKQRGPGTWLRPDTSFLKPWLLKLHKSAKARGESISFHPVIVEFQELVERDPVVRMYMTDMITQIPKKYHSHHLKSVNHLFQLLNEVLTQAPEYNHTAVVACPFSAILIWTMGTPAGFAAYRHEKINAMFKKLLKVWSDFLNSKESLYVLNPGMHGWKSEAAQKQLKMQNYQYAADEKYWGFSSWNDFFTRKLKPGIRPIDDPQNHKVISGACDSTVYKISNNVQKYSQFWIKSQPYSLNDMLANDESVDQFVGGNVYQAYLNPFNYHRWHSPVTGTIRKAFVKEGLYFSQANCMGEDPTDQNHSEGYITHVQTRAIIIIESDDPKIGLVCVMPVGMVEVSSCIIHEKIKPGHHVKKGDELGYFQFGGSTYCLVFRPGVVKKFTVKRNQFCEMGKMIAIAN
jgi:phosphatidylserine decarboxylase